MLLLACLYTNAHGFVRDSWVHGHFLELAFGFNGFFVFYWSFCFVIAGGGVVLLWFFPQEMYIFMTWHKTLLNVPGILLTSKDGFDSEGCWYFEVEVTRV
jgi:hypothetical protein